MSEPYSLAVEGFPPEHFRVHAFTGREAISETYAFDVVVTSDFTGEEDVERDVLGRRAVFTWSIGAGQRVFHGLLVAVELVEVHEAAPRSVRHRLRFVPRMWLLKRKRRSRIFQHLRVRDIVDAVLGEAGIATTAGRSSARTRCASIARSTRRAIIASSRVSSPSRAPISTSRRAPPATSRRRSKTP